MTAKSTRPLLPVLLCISYPLLAHASVIWKSPLLQWLALIAVLAVPFLAARNPVAWLWYLLLTAVLGTLTFAGGGQYALYLPALLIPAAVSATFGLSLREGRTPLITAIAQAARGSLPADLRDYTRRLTAFWALLSAGITTVTLYLTLAGPLWAWSLHTNFVSYLLIGGVLVGEFVLRRFWFPAHDHPGFIEYLRIVARGRPRA